MKKGMENENTIDQNMLLMEYASGALNEAHSLLAATYVSVSEDARNILNMHEAIAGALLEDVCDDATMRADSLDAVLSKLDDLKDYSEHKTNDHSEIIESLKCTNILPSVLQQHICKQNKQPKWRPLAKGVKFYNIKTNTPNYKVTLLKAEPGMKTPEHDHHGSEMTLVLDGAFHDGESKYVAGDLIIEEDHGHHEPVADAEMGCICLVVTDAPVKFTGRLMRLLNWMQ